MKCSPEMNSGSAMLPLATSTARTAKAQTFSSSDILLLSPAIFASRILPNLEHVLVWKAPVAFYLKCSGKNESNSISRLPARNSARLLQAMMSETFCVCRLVLVALSRHLNDALDVSELCHYRLQLVRVRYLDDEVHRVVSVAENARVYRNDRDLQRRERRHDVH